MNTQPDDRPLHPPTLGDKVSQLAAQMAAMEAAHHAQIHDARSACGAHILRLETALDKLAARVGELEAWVEQNTGDGK